MLRPTHYSYNLPNVSMSFQKCRSN